MYNNPRMLIHEQASESYCGPTSSTAELRGSKFHYDRNGFQGSITPIFEQGQKSFIRLPSHTCYTSSIAVVGETTTLKKYVRIDAEEIVLAIHGIWRLQGCGILFGTRPK